MDATAPLRLAIVGGGITGLAAAWHARRLASEAGRDLDVIVLEAGARAGGKVRTVRDGEWVIEGAPDSFLTTKPWAHDLAIALGLGDRRIVQRPGGRRVFVRHRGRLVPLPAGFRLAAPTAFGPFLRTPLLSWRGKLRAGLDWILPARRDTADESMAAFVRRRMGREVLERLAAPLMAGIYVGDPERLSIQATFPQLVALERSHGSLIRGLRRSAAAGEAGSSAAAAFVSLAGGVGDLIDALAADLGPIVRTGAVVDRIGRGADAAAYAVRLVDGTVYEADAVVVTTPAPVAARLLADVAPEAARIAGGVRHLSSATVSLGYRREAVGHPLDGLGIIVARAEGVRWAACSWSSSKWDGRAPAGHVLVRLFYGGEGREDDARQDEATLVRWAVEDAGAILDARGEPVLARAFRWIDGNPQYDVGHAARAAAAAAACPDGLVLAGASWGGVGLPDCVRQGLEAATTVLRVERSHVDGGIA
ncbi:MAG: protoporphyrinogen oxidase [Ardenticatenales bacterium]